MLDRVRRLIAVPVVGALAVCLVVTACSDPKSVAAPEPSDAPASPASASPSNRTDLLPGMPVPLREDDVYAAAAPGNFSDATRGARELVYVPNTDSNDVYVIDPKTFKVIDKFPGGHEPQHVIPSYDMTTLYVASDINPGDGLIPIDPKTGKPGKAIQVQDPYNMYFTPDGRYAVVMAEYYRRMDYYDPVSWKLVEKVDMPQCKGLNHGDFTADGALMLVACEFANRVVVVDTATHKVVRQFELNQHHAGMPQDTRLTPDGRSFYVADMMAGGIYVFDASLTHPPMFIKTGDGAHGVYFSRDSKRAFITNRGEGSVTVIDPATHKIQTKWKIPGGGSPDMGSVSPDGTQLWLSGRYHREVYVLSTVDGHLIARIPAGIQPHGLTYWPQPGRYSLGHTGNIR